MSAPEPEEITVRVSGTPANISALRAALERLRATAQARNAERLRLLGDSMPTLRAALGGAPESPLLSSARRAADALLRLNGAHTAPAERLAWTDADDLALRLYIDQLGD